MGRRRGSIVDDCFQMKMDADHVNEASPNKKPIQPVLDFTYDVAEREALEDGDESAASSPFFHRACAAACAIPLGCSGVRRAAGLLPPIFPPFTCRDVHDELGKLVWRHEISWV